MSEVANTESGTSMDRSSHSRNELTIVDYATCNALGMSNADVYRSLREEKCPLKPHPEFDGMVCGALPEPLPPLLSKLSAYDTRVNRMVAVALQPLQNAIERAIRRWGSDRVAIVLGSSTAGIDATEVAYAAYKRDGAIPRDYNFTNQHAYSSIVYVARQLTGIRGPGTVVSTACSSGTKAFCSAYRLLASDLVDAVLVGGVDTLCHTTLKGFRSLSILSDAPCRPFSRERNGITIGEGVGLCVLERKGEGPARLLGTGESSDAFHPSSPDPEGRGILGAMQKALQQSLLTPDAIDHINAHGTGTLLNDEVESQAIAKLFPSSVRVIATKGYTGHALGASGAIEVVLSLLAIENGWLPKSMGAEPLDPQVHVDITLRSEPMTSRFVLSNSFAFGGNNACVVIGSAV
jgi:3-oxoacyl-[acyl-carrier-protein] synthase-1